MALFIGVQHLCTFSKVAPLFYHSSECSAPRAGPSEAQEPMLQFCVCIFGFKGASTSKIIGARNEKMMDDYEGQMIFGDLGGLKLPDIRLTGEEKPRKNIT